jgi:hypothetical protein
MTDKQAVLDLFEARKIASTIFNGKYEIEFLAGHYDDGDLVRSIIAGIKRGREPLQEDD